MHHNTFLAALAAVASSLSVHATPLDQVIINFPLAPAAVAPVAAVPLDGTGTFAAPPAVATADHPPQNIAAVIRTYKKREKFDCSGTTGRDWDLPIGNGCWYLQDQTVEVIYQHCGNLKVFVGKDCDGTPGYVNRGTCNDVHNYHSIMVEGCT